MSFWSLSIKAFVLFLESSVGFNKVCTTYRVSSFHLRIVACWGEISIEEARVELHVGALTPWVTHPGNGSAGMTGIRDRVSAASTLTTAGLQPKQTPVGRRENRGLGHLIGPPILQTGNARSQIKSERGKGVTNLIDCPCGR